MKEYKNLAEKSESGNKKLHLSDVMAMLPTKEELDNHINKMSCPNEDWCGYSYDKGFEAGVMWLIEKIKGN